METMEAWMDKQSFDILEKKIDQLLIAFKQLKEKNQGLQQKNLELETMINEKDNQLITLKSELEKYQNAQLEIVDFKNKQDRVKNKVETLLEKLKEFEALE